MKVFLVQHAEAKSEEEDPARHLTDKGVVDAEKLGKFLADNGVRPLEIWHSGKTRAAQTAKAIADCFQEEIELVEKHGMAPKDHPKPITEELQDGVMVVGHLPFLGKMAARMLTDHEKVPIVSFSSGKDRMFRSGQG